MQQCWKCPNNKVPPVPRNRVTVEVEDATSVTTFVLFDKHIMKMIMDIVNNMLGKRYVFKLRRTSYNIVKKGEGITVTQVEEVKAADFNNAQPQAVN